MTDNKPLFSTSLTGLTLPNVGVPDIATATVGADGDLVVSLLFSQFIPMFLLPDPQDLGALGDDGSVVSLHSAVVQQASSATADSTGRSSSSLRMTALRLNLTGVATAQADWNRKELWLHGPLLFGRVVWAFAGYDFELAPHAIEPTPGVRASCLTVRRNIGTPDAEFAQILDATLDLVSVADRVRCRVFLQTTFRDSVVLAREAIPYPNMLHGTHPLIPPVDLGKFVTESLPSYLQRKDDWALRTLVGFYCRSHYESLAEAKFIFAGVFMEALKFHWALNVGKLAQDRKQSGLIRGFKRPTGGLYSFEELMTLVAADLKLKHAYTFIDDRNALFHSGQAAIVQKGGGGGTWQALRPELELLHDQMDELLLALFGYSGKIRGFWSQSTQRVFVAPS
jgi:hypothetical protein